MPSSSAADRRVDAYIEKHEQWASMLHRIRKVLLELNMEEAVKWGGPAYLVDGKIVIGIAGFKHHCGIWFHQGVFINDDAGVLSNAQEGVTKAMRQWRFESGDKINITLLKRYVREAIANSRAGKAVKPDTKKQLTLPQELRDAMGENAKLKKAFEKLTPGRQREYADHIASAKQAKTRLTRLGKSKPLILSGAGLMDKYRNC